MSLFLISLSCFVDYEYRFSVGFDFLPYTAYILAQASQARHPERSRRILPSCADQEKIRRDAQDDKRGRLTPPQTPEYTP